MKYMLLIYSPETGWTQEEWTQCVVESSFICHQLAAKRQYLAASPLHPVATAETVRVREGRPLITTGPFAETVEQLGGYYIIDVDNLDEAIAIASSLPPAKKGTVEIRPLMEIDGLPAEKSAAERKADSATKTKFMFLCYDDEEAWGKLSTETQRADMDEAVRLTHQLDQKGQYLSASPLHPSSTATCIRVRNGQRLVTDGPFTETREVLGGYYLILASNRDEAVRIAAKHSGARLGAVEVRPVFEIPSIPIPTDREIMSSRDVPFSRDQVYGAFSNPERLARWWGPAGFRNTFHRFEFKAGGEWQFTMHGPDGTNYENQSVFRTVSPEKIVFDHVCAPHFQMTITLGELPNGGTRIVWRMAFETVDLRNNIAKFAGDANEQNFDRLVAELSSK